MSIDPGKLRIKAQIHLEVGQNHRESEFRVPLFLSFKQFSSIFTLSKAIFKDIYTFQGNFQAGRRQKNGKNV